MKTNEFETNLAASGNFSNQALSIGLRLEKKAIEMLEMALNHADLDVYTRELFEFNPFHDLARANAAHAQLRILKQVKREITEGDEHSGLYCSDSSVAYRRN